MSNRQPKPTYRKLKRKAVLYDLDILNQQQLIRVDLIIESADEIITPVVPLYEARFTEDNPNALAKRGFDPRSLSNCFRQNNREVRRTVFNPYRPNDPTFVELVKQLFTIFDIATITYSGETHEKKYEDRL
jgi:hypothetical protein